MISSLVILKETCPQHFRENVTVTDLYLISENIVPMKRVLDRGPYFDTSATKNVTSLVGITGHLNCRIKNLGNKTVSSCILPMFTDVLLYILDYTRLKDMKVLYANRCFLS